MCSRTFRAMGFKIEIKSWPDLKILILYLGNKIKDWVISDDEAIISLSSQLNMTILAIKDIDRKQNTGNATNLI